MLLGAGVQDTWYTAGMLAADEQFLASRDVERQIVRFDGGHDWTDAFRLAAGRWLEAFSR